VIHRPDLVILGSGPAGCAAAVRLAELWPLAPRRVVLLERARHPRRKGCGGGLTGRTAPLLEWLGLPASPEGALPVGRMRLCHEPRHTTLEMSQPIPVVRRWQLDAQLADRAGRCVADLRQGEPARAVRRDGDWLEVETDGAIYRTPIVIDASGSRCVTRRSGLLPQGQPLVPVWIAEGPPQPGEAAWEGEPELIFDFSEMASGCPGYYWSFPCLEDGVRWVNRGFYPAAGLGPAAARGALERRLLAGGIDPAQVPFAAYPARMFQPGIPTAAPGVLTAGDAAGVDPLFGEGIAQSLEYGRLAAARAARALTATGSAAAATAFHPDEPLRHSALGLRLWFLARMHDELYVPTYQRRLAFALSNEPFLKLVHRDTVGGLPSPALWAGMLALALFQRRFGDLDLHRPDRRVVQV